MVQSELQMDIFSCLSYAETEQLRETLGLIPDEGM